MGEATNYTGETQRIVSKSSRRELKQHLDMQLEGKHFDGKGKSRVGQYVYRSSTFPLKRGDLALVQGYSGALSPEAVAGMLAEDTNRAMRHDKGKASSGDSEYDLKGIRNIKISDTFPIVGEDMIELAFIGFKFEYEGEEMPYVDLLKGKQYSLIPPIYFKMVALSEYRLIAHTYSDSGQPIENKAQTLAEVIQKATDLGDFELPDGKRMDIHDIANQYNIIKVHVQIQTHIKSSEEGEYVGYQSGLKVEDLTDKIEGETMADMLIDDKDKEELAKAVGVDPHADTQIVEPPKKSTKDRTYDMLETVPWDSSVQEPKKEKRDTRPTRVFTRSKSRRIKFS
jgi:hypothetical protein